MPVVLLNQRVPARNSASAVSSVATAAGMAIHRTNVPSKDATVVARLKQAGAVILGKLQMTEGAFGAHHPSIPAPLNPWNET